MDPDAIFTSPDKARSVEVTYAAWKKRGCWKRFMEILTAPFRAQL